MRFSDLGNITRPSLVNFDLDMFRLMCILSGCDYCDSLPGIGLKKAHELVRRHRTVDGVLAALRADPKRGAGIPAAYEERCRLADLTFKHQRVWDHVNGCVAFLTPAAEPTGFGDGPESDYLGPMLDPDVAYGVSCGHLNPHTHQPLAPPPVVAATPASGRGGATKTPDPRQMSMTSFFSRSASKPTPPSSAPTPVASADSARARGVSPGVRNALEEFKRAQAERALPPDVLAPATPEKPKTGESTRKPILGTPFFARGGVADARARKAACLCSARRITIRRLRSCRARAA